MKILKGTLQNKSTFRNAVNAFQGLLSRSEWQEGLELDDFAEALEIDDRLLHLVGSDAHFVRLDLFENAKAYG